MKVKYRLTGLSSLAELITSCDSGRRTCSNFLWGKDECVAFSFAQVNRDITPITSRVELIGNTKLDTILFDAFPLQNPPNTLKMLRLGLTKAVPATDLREL
jgi:hypothetical protein